MGRKGATPALNQLVTLVCKKGKYKYSLAELLKPLSNGRLVLLSGERRRLVDRSGDPVERSVLSI